MEEKILSKWLDSVDKLKDCVRIISSIQIVHTYHPWYVLFPIYVVFVFVEVQFLEVFFLVVRF